MPREGWPRRWRLLEGPAGDEDRRAEDLRRHRSVERELELSRSVVLEINLWMAHGLSLPTKAKCFSFVSRDLSFRKMIKKLRLDGALLPGSEVPLLLLGKDVNLDAHAFEFQLRDSARVDFS